MSSLDASTSHYVWKQKRSSALDKQEQTWMKSKPYQRIESHLSPADGRISVLWLHTDVKCEFSADHHGRIVVGLHCGQMLVHTLGRKVKGLKKTFLV